MSETREKLERDIALTEKCEAHWQLRADGDEVENDEEDWESCAYCATYNADGEGCAGSMCPWSRVRGVRCVALGEPYSLWSHARWDYAYPPDGQWMRPKWASLPLATQQACQARAAKVVATLQKIKAALKEELAAL